MFKYFFVVLVFGALISCSEQTKSEESYCSAENPNGICKDTNKVCLNGICIRKEVICEPECLDGYFCDNGKCVKKESECKNDDFKCSENKEGFFTCENGNWSEIVLCGSGKYCNESKKECSYENNTICTPGKKKCSLDLSKILTCDSEGKNWLETVCEANTFCYSENGNHICKENLTSCSPGEKICSSYTSYKVCNSEGTAYSEPVNCPNSSNGSPLQCILGECKTECEIAEIKKSYMGCRYYGVDLDNMGGIFRNDESETPFYYSVIVANPSDFTANVKIKDDSGLLEQRDVLPGSIEIFNFDTLTYRGTSDSSGRTFHEWVDTHQIVKTSRGRGYSYEIISDFPIIAYQFSPLGGSNNYSNDASLLIPVSVYDKEYRMLSWEHWKTSPQTMTIVAREDNTSVTINFKAPTLAGENIPSQNENSLYSFTLSKGEVIQFASSSGDLSGSYISADKPIGVFGGHSCTNIPNSKSACDHIEEQLLPVNTWGMHYIAVKTKKRGEETEYYKIVADEDNTYLQFNPPINVDGLSSPLSATTIRNSGRITIFSTKDSFELIADKPVMLGQFITSLQDVSINPLEHPTGDPAFILQVPVEQYRKNYLFLVPSTYAENYLTVVASPDYEGNPCVVKLDGNAINSSEYISVGSYYYTIKNIVPGAHSVVSECKTGISVYGYDQYVSYGYPGGLDLKNIKGR